MWPVGDILFEDAGLVDPDATLFGELRPKIIDLFAGIGGTSQGVWLGLGRHPDVAINHWLYAIRTHLRNHPTTLHYLEDVWNVGPREAARGMPVDLLVGSPDCTDHSNAKGSAPRSTGRRALADVFVRWAREVRPRVIILENVREFRDWGPLDASGQRIKARKGEEFRRWVRELEAEGYVVEWRILSACDYGAPTTRPRLFVIARCDGQPIVWPEPTHGPGRIPHRAAAEIIDWSIPTRTIFGRKKPLAENTLRRIALGVQRFVVDNPQPFLLTVGTDGRLIAPAFCGVGGRSGQSPPTSVEKPLGVVTTKNDRALVAATLVETGNGERPGQTPRARDIARPLGTVTASDSQGALVAALLQRHNHEPGRVPATDCNEPLPTVCARVNQSLITTSLGRGGGNAHLVAAFLATYHTTGGQWSDLHRPCPTVTAREGIQLVTVTIGGATYVIEDIGIRMLRSHELAAAQGFPADYHLEGSESDRITGIGNSVVPQVMAALVSSNCASGARRAA